MPNTNVNTGTGDKNSENQRRIAELQKKESDGQLSDEEAAELQRLQQETSAA